MRSEDPHLSKNSAEGVPLFGSFQSDPASAHHLCISSQAEQSCCSFFQKVNFIATVSLFPQLFSSTPHSFYPENQHLYRAESPSCSESERRTFPVDGHADTLCTQRVAYLLIIAKVGKSVLSQK